MTTYTNATGFGKTVWDNAQFASGCLDSVKWNGGMPRPHEHAWVIVLFQQIRHARESVFQQNLSNTAMSMQGSGKIGSPIILSDLPPRKQCSVWYFLRG